MKSTPGPWHFIENDSSMSFHSHSIRGQNSVQAYYGSKGPLVVGLTASPEAIANGYLLASAPELLQASEMVYEVIKRIPVNQIPELAHAAQFMVMAMKKARGEV